MHDRKMKPPSCPDVSTLSVRPDGWDYYCGLLTPPTIQRAVAKYTDRIFDFRMEQWFFCLQEIFLFPRKYGLYLRRMRWDTGRGKSQKISLLKEALLPEIEIVQMKYRTVSEFNTVLNARTVQLPKTSVLNVSGIWGIDPIHETIHAPHWLYLTWHWDFTCSPCTTTIFHFRRLPTERDIFCQASAHAKELLKTGWKRFCGGTSDFHAWYMIPAHDTATHRKKFSPVCSHILMIAGDINRFFQMTLWDKLSTPCFEICLETLELILRKPKIMRKLPLRHYNAAHETSSILDVHTGGDLHFRDWSAVMR